MIYSHPVWFLFRPVNNVGIKYEVLVVIYSDLRVFRNLVYKNLIAMAIDRYCNIAFFPFCDRFS